VLFTWRPDLLVLSRFPQLAGDAGKARALASSIFQHADWQAFDRGTLDQRSVVQRTVQRLQLPHAEVDALVAAIAEHLTPITGTVDIVHRLHQQRLGQADVRLYYLSNMPEPFARGLQARHGFLQHFDGGIFSGDVQLAKPQPEIFQLLESRYSLMPCDTVFIDDLAANVEAAGLRGWRGIHFESPAQLALELAAHLDDSQAGSTRQRE
ncbi:MAG: HAD family phosphatase, partial [Rhodoferax sp.]|nr:HAD family phosphatase [Rhodoferax sp.]